MKYWFIIHGELAEDVAKDLWRRIKPFKANLTVLFDKAYVYGDADDPETVEEIAKELGKLENRVERG